MTDVTDTGWRCHKQNIIHKSWASAVVITNVITCHRYWDRHVAGHRLVTLETPVDNVTENDEWCYVTPAEDVSDDNLTDDDRWRHRQSLMMSQTSSDNSFMSASLTRDLTTVTKLTPTVFNNRDCLASRTSSTTENLATVDAYRCPIADPSSSTERPNLLTASTVVRWDRRVHEVLRSVSSKRSPSYRRHLRSILVGDHHVDGGVVAFHQPRSNLVQRRHLSPACLQCTRPRQAMTFTYRSHIVLGSLKCVMLCNVQIEM